jgi:hypothetical protein
MGYTITHSLTSGFVLIRLANRSVEFTFKYLYSSNITTLITTLHSFDMEYIYT